MVGIKASHFRTTCMLPTQVDVGSQNHVAQVVVHGSRDCCLSVRLGGAVQLRGVRSRRTNRPSSLAVDACALDDNHGQSSYQEDDSRRQSAHGGKGCAGGDSVAGGPDTVAGIAAVSSARMKFDARRHSDKSSSSRRCGAAAVPGPQADTMKSEARRPWAVARAGGHCHGLGSGPGHVLMPHLSAAVPAAASWL